MQDRIIQFLQLEQLSPSRFADILGVQRSGISHILSGRNKPGFDLIEKILLKFPGINAEWLITGKGKMYKEIHNIPPVYREADLFATPPPSVSVQEPDLPVFSVDKPTIAKPIDSFTESKNSRTITKIVIFYADKTFSEYEPGE